ncbi:hypothetical protein B566_EDAN002227 [Ephemera danica]|nr:hypothetical protein B566_EDAN002227 [Ephemera danica]
MWHEARKQEKKIRGMMVDYKKRAERRREFYEKTKADPTQFLQLHGRKSKIYVDPTIATAADSPANMMPWLGQTDNLIDRFDVRAHLDHIPEVPTADVKVSSTEDTWEERQVNYERYRILVQNEFLGVSEEKFLHQIHLEEQFGFIGTQQKAKEDEKKKLAEKKAAIAYTYEDSTPQPARPVAALVPEPEQEEDDEDVSDIDFGNDFYSLLTRDLEEQEALRLAREHEEEKAIYAARESPTYDAYRKSMSKSRSRSHSPVNSGQITYITSFGGEESEEEDTKVQGPVMPTKAVKKKAPPVVTVSAPRNSEAVATHAKAKPKSRAYFLFIAVDPEAHLQSTNLHDVGPVNPLMQGGGHALETEDAVEVASLEVEGQDQVLVAGGEVGREAGVVRGHTVAPGTVEVGIGAGDTGVPPRKFLQQMHSSSSSIRSSSKSHSSDSSVRSRRSKRHSSLSSSSSSSSRSRSPSVTRQTHRSPSPRALPAPPLKRSSPSVLGNSGAGTKVNKADKKAEREKKEKAEQERQDREEELREISQKLRRKLARENRMKKEKTKAATTTLVLALPILTTYKPLVALAVLPLLGHPGLAGTPLLEANVKHHHRQSDEALRGVATILLVATTPHHHAETGHPPLNAGNRMIETNIQDPTMGVEIVVTRDMNVIAVETTAVKKQEVADAAEIIVGAHVEGTTGLWWITDWLQIQRIHYRS